ncbi:MAG: hypothetical protein ACJ72W_07160 [Actinoallomurus sp.]
MSAVEAEPPPEERAAILAAADARGLLEGCPGLKRVVEVSAAVEDPRPIDRPEKSQ